MLTSHYGLCSLSPHTTPWFWHQAFLGGPTGSQSLLSSSWGALRNSICFLGPYHTTWAYPNSTGWHYSLSHCRLPMQAPRQDIHLVAFKSDDQGFPGGSVVESLPANAGDMSSIPGPGGSHTQRSNWAHASQLWSLCSRAREPQLLSPSATTPEAHALQQEKAPQREASLLKLENSPARRNERKASAARKTQHRQK